MPAIQLKPIAAFGPAYDRAPQRRLDWPKIGLWAIALTLNFAAWIGLAWALYSQVLN